MLTLHVSQSRLDDGRHRVLLRVSGDGLAAQEAVSSFPWEVDRADRERVRWYLEDFLEYPLDPAPAIAAGVEARLGQLGGQLFDAVFADRDARDLWARLRDRLPELRVEIASEVDEATTLPWELLRDPASEFAVALQAASFVRVNFRPSTPVRLAARDGSRLRVLLVICRPQRDMDVPFRSVARHLVGLGASASPLDVDVLRPPTFAALAERLESARASGVPYQVVHFDGHGAYLDLTEAGGGAGFSQLQYRAWSRVSPPRPGRHGFLVFEDPDTVDNRQYVDGPALGALLARTGVSVLVLNACRSAYAEARTEPAAVDDPAAADVHARVRAYGSLALEVTDAGVAGVVAMRYSVYVVTAAQFVADLYAALLAGQPLGAAVSAGRRQLAARPLRAIAFEPRELQDWSVPVVYEAAPVPLFATVHDGVTLDAGPAAADVAGLPPSPDVGFFGRDETLLALDRAFDTHRVVLLHAYAGAGKTSTAVEFARWYRATGGLSHPQLGDGPVLFSSLEHHTPLAVLLNQLADEFDPLLQANGVQWQALDDERRRRIAVQLLGQVPVLWIWDNVEPVAGFPAGTPSAWSQAEQAELAGFLRELVGTRARVLLTSRRDELGWLGDLPARVRLPGMPMREAVQLTRALAERRGHRITEVADWRPLLQYAGGNPLAITVLVGQALRERLTSRADIEAFVARLRAGEADLADDAEQGRSRSLGASLGYGFAHAFTDAERARLAVLHLFQETVDVEALVAMGDPDQDPSVPHLHGLTRETGIALLDRAAEIGLLTPLGAGYYRIHPALPWYFTHLFAASYGPADQPAATEVTHAYTAAIGGVGNYYHDQYISGHHQVIDALRVEEANLLHARALARRHHRWHDVMGCMQGLRILYDHTGRTAQWAQLVDELVPALIDPATDQPVPGREDQWSVFTEYRVRLARQARDWETSHRLQITCVAWDREQATDALAADPDRLTDRHRYRIRNLAASLHALGSLQREQQLPDCVTALREAADLCRRIGARTEEATTLQNLGSAYLDVTGLRDLDQAEHWFRRALDLCEERDSVNRAATIAFIGDVAADRFHGDRKAGKPAQKLAKHLTAAAAAYHQALDLMPGDNVTARASFHNRLGNVYDDAGRLEDALGHYRQAIRNHEDSGDHFGAGQSRFNVALTLAGAGRVTEALLYAQAALRDFEPYGASAASDIDDTRELIAEIERGDFGSTG